MEIEPDNASSDRPAFDPLRFATIQRSFIFHPELVSAMKLLLTRLSAIAQFQSPRHLEELQLSDETNKCVSVLKNPANGNLVYLIGTFGFSKASADDVKSLIEAVHPDALALEITSKRLQKLHDPQNNWTAANAILPNTTWKVLGSLWRGRSNLLATCTRFLLLFAWRVYKPEEGCDMLSALPASRQLDIPIELLDPCPNPLVWPSGGDLGLKALKEKSAVLMGLLNTCWDDMQGAFDALARAWASFLAGRPVPIQDVIDFRSNFNQYFDSLRYDQDGTLTRNFELKKSPSQLAARDARILLMSSKLAAVASKHKKVVAVVSSRNVPSIRAGFAELTLSALENPDDMASTRGGQVSSEERTHREKRSVSFKTAAQVTGGVILGALGLACFKWPFVMAAFCTGLFFLGLALLVGFAAIVAWCMRFADSVNEADRLAGSEFERLTSQQ